MIVEINPKYQSLKVFIDDIKTHFEASTQTLYDQRNIIRIINLENENYVVKAFKVPNLLNRIAYRYLRPSKAKRSYQYSLKIGTDLTPEPIAYIEESTNGLLGKSYYISRHFDYDHTIHEVLIDKDLPDRDQILKEFADFTYKLHQLEILHHDYSHGNILIKKISDSNFNYQFKIIDINRMEFKSLNLAARLNNFARIKADDDDMKIIIGQYAKQIDDAEKDLLEKAIHYRDEFYRKRELTHRLRGKA